jgi:release factor glutamine methyltransferase
VNTVGAIFGNAAARLRSRDPDGARYDATLLLAHVLARDPAWLLAHDDAPVAPADRARYDAAVARRLRGEPVPYIVGTAGFYGRAFAVDANTLVPRPETEALVEVMLQSARRNTASGPPRICDVGTGSGAIAVTLACELPEALLTAVDVSPAALEVARRNAEAHGVAGRVRFVLGDGLAAAAAPGGYTGVAANLPYVPTDDLPEPPDPASFEPRLALDGGPDGLLLYRALLRDAAVALVPDGTLVMEAGPDTVTALAALARAAFPSRDVSIGLDYAGLARLVVVAHPSTSSG